MFKRVPRRVSDWRLPTYEDNNCYGWGVIRPDYAEMRRTRGQKGAGEKKADA